VAKWRETRGYREAEPSTELVGPALTLERLVTHPRLADLPASPLQRAICRVADGVPVGEALGPIERERHFGTTKLPSDRPQLMTLICGVRGGKSFLAACAAIWTCLTIDMGHMKPYEVAQFLIVGPVRKKALETLILLRGIVESSPVLSRCLAREPTQDTLTLKRPDGRVVDIMAVAAGKSGTSFRGMWLAGFVLEECAQFGSASDGAAVNADDILSAARPRLMRGGIGWLISSPFGPTGLLYDMWREHFGAPSSDVVVVHAPTLALNPSFDQRALEAERQRDPDNARREYDAEWLDAECSFYASAAVDRATRDAPLIRPPVPGTWCAAGMDTATRGNSWTLAVAWAVPTGRRAPDNDDEDEALRGMRVTVGGCWQWTGSKSAPLVPSVVLRQIAAILRPYAVRSIHVDRWSFDAMNDIARSCGLNLIEQPSPAQTEAYGKLSSVLANSIGDEPALELPPGQLEPGKPAHERSSNLVRADLVAVRKRATAGGVRVELPRTTDGRHCDFAPAISTAVAQAIAIQTRPVVRRNLRNLPTV